MTTSPDRRLVLALPGLALWLGVPLPADAATIVGVRVWPARAYTRVTLESDVALAARHFLVDDPPRLVVDVDGLELGPALRELVGKIRPDDPYIAGVRVGQYQPRVLRLVIDLKQPVQPQLFALEPIASYRHRLVFDLYPLQEADPLLALLQERPPATATPPAGPSPAPDVPSAGPAGSGLPAATAAASGAPAGGPSVAAPPPDALGELIARIEQAAPASPPGPPLVTAVPPPVVAAMTPGSAAAVGAPAAAPRARPPAPAVATARRTDRFFIVALDPGHGGEDPGAIGPTGLREKDVVLAIALQLKRRLQTDPSMRVMLTREGDYFVPLRERVRKARRVQADLFVSIHADAFMRREARGASVFALSDRGATSAAARWMAERENAADDVGGVNVDAQGDAQLLRTLADMSTTAQIRDSLRVGREVLTNLGRVGRLHKRQVEQAGFAVLKAPDIPSILVETAFISNPEEEALLRQASYRRELVEAMAQGIQRHFAARPPMDRSRPT